MANKVVDYLTKVTVSMEIIYHFRCPRCDGWWTIGEFSLRDITNKGRMTCPHCDKMLVVNMSGRYPSSLEYRGLDS